MKTRMNKTLRIVTAMAFVVALLLNLKLSLNDSLMPNIDEVQIIADETTTVDDEKNVDASCIYMDAEGEVHQGAMVICFPGTYDCTPTECKPTGTPV